MPRLKHVVIFPSPFESPSIQAGKDTVLILLKSTAMIEHFLAQLCTRSTDEYVLACVCIVSCTTNANKLL